jgi:hypothetical protein
MWTSSFSFLAGMPLIFLINGFQVGYFSKSVKTHQPRLGGALISISDYLLFHEIERSIVYIMNCKVSKVSLWQAKVAHRIDVAQPGANNS